jgi:hypothetical protein
VAGWVAKGRVTGGGDLLSTDWDVYCLDCDDSLGLDGTKSFVLALIRDAPALAELGESLKKLPDLDIEISVYGRQIPLSWFVLHGKHRLIAKDEYGHLDDECGARFKCGRCDVDSYCKRARGHDGDHANRRDKE